MPLIDTRGFNLVPDIGAQLGRGLQVAPQLSALEQQGRANQIRQLLGQAAQTTTPQQQMLAAQTGDMGVQDTAGQTAPTAAQLEAQARQIDPVLAEKMLAAMGMDTESKREEASRFAAQLQGTPFDKRGPLINARAQMLQQQGRDNKDTLSLLDLDEAQQNQALTNVQLAALSTKERFSLSERATRAAEVPAEQRAFESLIKDLPPEEQKQAKLIKLGLQPRAVGSAIQTISEQGIADEVANASATIKQREKFAEMTGASRAKTIDKGFEQIVRIDQGINTIDRAISALEGGAKTGAIQRFLPSMRAASVELENIRNQFALDVIGGVTLGAISEAELALAKQVGLPEGLDEPQLIEHLKQRRAAQEKLRNYYREQVDFLDKGGTVAGFLRMKERERESIDSGKEAPEQVQQITPSKVGRFTVEVEG